MVYLTLSAIAVFFSLTIIRDKDTFFNCPVKIEILFIVFSAFRLIPAKAVDRFSAVCSASARSRVWRNICYSNS
jgi:intracellular septation protein A